jgi:hypothetical protein
MLPEGDVLKNKSAGITRVWAFRKFVGMMEAEVSERLGLVFQGEVEGRLYRMAVAERAY